MGSLKILLTMILERHKAHYITVVTNIPTFYGILRSKFARHTDISKQILEIQQYLFIYIYIFSNFQNRQDPYYSLKTIDNISTIFDVSLHT